MLLLNSKKDPVVIWLTGGPGCSSKLALFHENGPFQIANMSLVWNDFGWDKASNLIYVDQPVGTGFSYTSDDSDIRHDENGISNNSYDFLQLSSRRILNTQTMTSTSLENPMLGTTSLLLGFTKETKPKKGFTSISRYFFFSCSFLDLTPPPRLIWGGNKNSMFSHVNQGFAIGNGLTHPAIQYQAYPDYALNQGIIKESDHKSISKMIPACEQAIKQCGAEDKDSCLTAYFACTNIFNKIMESAGDLNYYDIRKKCETNLSYDFSNMETFLNQKSVREALGVGDIDFVSCSTEVYEAMQMDWMKNLEAGIPALLEDGIKLLVYAGKYDLICNWLVAGNSRWVHAMEWSGQKDFTAAPTVSFTVDGTEGPLSFLKVHDAGDMVPMDQTQGFPRDVQDVDTRFTNLDSDQR